MSIFSILSVVLLIGWLLLMLRASIAEYRYYRAVAIHEPETWAKLDVSNHSLAPFLFWVSPSRKRLLATVDNPRVLACERHAKATGRWFLGYVVAVLLSAIAFFKWT
ncbi:hypothetical protein ACMAY6_07025 [Luminiphilus sp. nBUS_16]|uniref:hypothetical protein n=1 Tax=Luminiphilus sp. nBUS_16 TaxID=3395315 RepID=UPI003EBC2BE3|tara:strand:+ start:178 stop:498 length:321 start_codon:yes stop_codon:yes gene_type:complete